MRLINVIAFLVPLAFASTTSHLSTADLSSKVTYDGYHVYAVRFADDHEADKLEKRFEKYHTIRRRDTVNVAVPPLEVRNFNSLRLDARLLSTDLGQQIRDESKSPVYKRQAGQLPDLSWFDTYHDYADHLQYWDDLAAAFPDNSERFELGLSHENRTIYAYHYFGGEGVAEDKPVVLYHSTVHAREWITTMVHEYFAYQLIDGYQRGDPNVTFFFDTYDFYLVPFHNPDGFSYTQTTDRQWRKNRQPRSNTTCVGTDLNRNWKYKWASNPGASPDPCAETFQGLSAGDTLENQAVSSLSDKLGARPAGIRSYVDLHSYGEKILTPFGWTCDPAQQPVTLPRMLEVAGGLAAVLNTYDGTNYTFGTGCDIEYYSSGNGRDHHYGFYNASHTWTLELDPLTDDDGGFVLPPDRIRPVVEEQWQGQLWVLNNVTQN
ncbi:MAG: hypothetical protein M1820_010426 [Bogoriella megaspora]|nr:MAG: hypothetical protein M1820_010426 [Bogoriella megaspora]